MHQSHKTIQIFDATSWDLLQELVGSKGVLLDLAWSFDSKRIAGGSEAGDNTIYIWNISDKNIKYKLTGHTKAVTSLSWFPGSNLLVSSGSNGDNTIRVWNTDNGRLIQLIEGHTNGVNRVIISQDGKLLVSKSSDRTIRLWSTDTWETLSIINEKYDGKQIAFHPHELEFVSLGNNGHGVRIWAINYHDIIRARPAATAVRYTTAKLVLVGDSGVGKTGLGWRLAHKEFKEHSSTHGQQFWVIPELGFKRDDGTECEAVLWDLAGQPDYRLVHSLYLDDVDLAMLVFDPTNRQEPLSGVDFWVNQLKDKDGFLRNSILVGARIDRGTPTLTDNELQMFCERNKISGGYIATSALDSIGLPELINKINEQIAWNQMTTTVTTVTFKRIKEFVLSLKEKPKQETVLIEPDELRNQLQLIDQSWNFSDAEMMAAVGHLENHGYLKVIHSSDGDHFILLTPDILANLASSIVLEARRNPQGLGFLEENRLLRGEYNFIELRELIENERKILLDATTVLFLERNVCFRETFNQQTFLVFPSLINEKHPLDETIKVEDGVSYRASGAVENVYASLVVLLGYTNTFTRTHQWQNQAQYELAEGEICGFKQTIYGEGEIELVLYYGLNTPEAVRLMFRGLFERFLSRKELEIKRYQPVRCKKCEALLARNVVLSQLGKGKDFSFCYECGEKVSLPNPEILTTLSKKEEADLDTQQAIAQYRTAFEAAIVRVKAVLRDLGKEKRPACFISYAWGISEQERRVLQLAKDLRNVGIDVLLDRWFVVPGGNLDRYIEQIMSTEYVIVVGTPKLVQKYETKTSDPVVTAELEMVNLRARQPQNFGHTIIPVLLDGEANTAFPPQLQKLIYVDFKRSAYYFKHLFDMIWRMYNLPFDNPLLEELRDSMTPQEIL